MPFVIRHSACRLLLRWCTAELDLGQSHKHGGRRHRPSLRVDEQPIDLGKLKPDPGHREHKRVTVVVTFPGRQWSRAKETLEQSRSSGWWRCLHCRPILTNAFSDTPASGKGACVGLPAFGAEWQPHQSRGTRCSAWLRVCCTSSRPRSACFGKSRGLLGIRRTTDIQTTEDAGPRGVRHGPAGSTHRTHLMRATHCGYSTVRGPGFTPRPPGGI